MSIALSSAELIAADHYVKREIMKLEEELPKWRTIIDTGAPPGRPLHITVHVYLLLSNQKFKGPYLEAEVVEEVMGWLG